jgi:hypothetical protein
MAGILQNFSGAEHSILFYAFDLLILAGAALRPPPLERWRALLRELIPALGDPVRHSNTFDVPDADSGKGASKQIFPDRTSTQVGSTGAFAKKALIGVLDPRPNFARGAVGEFVVDNFLGTLPNSALQKHFDRQ